MSESAVSVHQPNFMAWLKLLDKILASDVYVAYDTVQYTKSEYHARQRVKLPDGPQWLSVPVRSVRGRRQLIRDVHIDNSQPFHAKHLHYLRVGYSLAPYFDEVYSLVHEVYARNHEFLVDLNVDLLEALCRYLGSSVRIVRASDLAHEGDGTQRLIQLTRNAGGDIHLTATFGTERDYVDWQRLQAAGITARRQLFDHPVYDQPWGDFVPHLSALDMLFCCGPETKQVLEAGRQLSDVEPMGPAATGGGADRRPEAAPAGR